MPLARLMPHCSAASSPASHFTRALRSFSEAGLIEATAQTFVGEVQAPLSTECRVALTSLFEMLWGVASPEAAETDRMDDRQRLCQADSPDFILNLPEYYAFFTYTLFSGKVSK